MDLHDIKAGFQPGFFVPAFLNGTR